MTTVEIRCLGPLEVVVDGEPVALRRLEARLLSVLAWAPDMWVDHDALSEHVYFDADPRDTTSWRNHLRTSLGAARDVVETQRGRGSRLAIDGEVELVLDVSRYRAGVRGATDLLREGADKAALDALVVAESLWRGPTPFTEIADDIARHAGVMALQDERRQARRTLCRLAIDMGDYALALPRLREMAEDDPTDQATIALLMRASAAIGNPTSAGEYYDRLCRLLGDRGEIPTDQLVELHGRILRNDLPGERTTVVADLGVDLGTLFGRSEEHAGAIDSIARSRLVTLVGPAGAGKSRLAREVARSVGGTVALVQLAACADGEAQAVVRQVGDGLGVRRQRAEDLLEGAAAGFGDDPVLVVMDNCEHVLEPLTPILAGLLARCPGLAVLATSREPLGFPGEVVQPVRPLDVGTADAPGPAMRLCLERIGGGASAPLDEIAEVCRLLDGLPLAIEVVAPTVSALGPGSVLERLSGAGSVGGAVRADSIRHADLGAAISWGYSRLEPATRNVLLAASVHPAMVETAGVAAVAGLPDAEAATALGALADRSFLRLVGDGRYTVFETVRRFCRRAAREAGRLEELRARHAAWVASAASSDRSFPSALLADGVEAVRWAVETDDEEAAIDFIDAVRHDIYRMEPPSGLADRLDATSRRDDTVGLVASELWLTHALFQGFYVDIDARAQETIERVERLGQPERSIRARVVTAFSFTLAGLYDAAADQAAIADALAAEHGDIWSQGWAAAIDAYQLRRSHQYEAARLRAHRALELFDGIDYPEGKAVPLYALGLADFREHGDAASGLEYLRAGIRHADAAAAQLLASVGHIYSGQIHAETGDLEAARASVIAALRGSMAMPQRSLVVSSLEYAAVLLAIEGRAEEAFEFTSFSAHARWRFRLTTRSRAIPFLPEQVAAPLLVLPDRPSDRFPPQRPLAATLDRAVTALSS